MNAPAPLVTTALADFRYWLDANTRSGEPLAASVRTSALEQLDMLTSLAAAIDKEVAIHRQIMDGSHARRVALRLGAPGSETMQ